VAGDSHFYEEEPEGSHANDELDAEGGRCILQQTMKKSC